MNRWGFVVWIVGILTGCASAQMYPYPNSPLAEGPPVRYPLNYPICYERAAGGTLYVPLKIRVTGAGIPDPMQLMALRRKNSTEDGCFTAEYSRKPAKPLVWKKDSDNASYPEGAKPLDLTGHGHFAAVSYQYSLLNADDMRKEIEHEQTTTRTRAQNLIRLGFTYADVVKESDTVVINGLSWRHRLTAKYKTPDPGDLSKGSLLGWDEIYEHVIDSAHVLRQRAHYDAIVVADTEWIDARRALLRKLVEAIRIHPVAQVEIDAAVAGYDHQRAIDMKCGADKKCRAREGW